MRSARAAMVAMVLLVLGGSARAQKKPLRLAVMDFTAASTSTELAPLGLGLQSMITTDLGQVGAFVLVERARLKDIEAEVKLQESRLVDKETASKIGGLAGASHLLVGSFTVVGGKMRLDARLFAVASGEVLFGEKMEGAEASFFDLEKSLVKKIVDVVGIKLGKKERSDLARPQTQDYEAFQKYSQGLVLADQKRNEEAVVALSAAVARDPGFQLAAQRLAEVKALLSSAPKPSEPKTPSSCPANSLATPSCPLAPGQAAPPEFRAPTFITSDGRKPYRIIVRAGGEQLPCLTPCQVHLPKGPVDIEVVDHYKRSLVATGGPASVEVRTLNKTNIIIGSVLTGLSVIGLATSIGLREQSIDTATTGSTAYASREYWPLPLAMSAALVFPSIYYLVKMGKDDAKLVGF